jgi:hypothetical protein
MLRSLSRADVNNDDQRQRSNILFFFLFSGFFRSYTDTRSQQVLRTAPYPVPLLSLLTVVIPLVRSSSKFRDFHDVLS